MEGKGMRAWLHYERGQRRAVESISTEEKRNRLIAFREKFTPIMQEMGFCYRRNAFWKRCSNDYVQYVMLRSARGMPGLYYVGCGYEWSLAVHARLFIDDGLKCNFMKWYSTETMFINTLQRFVGACDRVETIGYGLFDEVDDYYEGLELEYQRFVEKAVPMMLERRVIEDYLQSKKNVSWANVLAYLMLGDYERASFCCDRVISSGQWINVLGARSPEAAQMLQSAIQQKNRHLIDNWIASCRESAEKDLRFI